MNFAELYGYWLKVRDAVPLAAEVGANRMAGAFQQKVKLDLSRYPHPAHTRSPSPPGAAPGMISGELKSSVTRTPAVPMGAATWVAHVGPHTVYAAIQEFGGVMHAHNAEYMTWTTDGVRHFQKVVVLPERPYMRPVAAMMSRDGEITRTALDGIASVLYPVEGI